MFNNQDVQNLLADHPGQYCVHAAVFQTACDAVLQTSRRMSEDARLEEAGLFGLERARRRARAGVFDAIADQALLAGKRMDRLIDDEGTGCAYHRLLYRVVDHWIVDWLTRSERMHREAEDMSGRAKELHNERGSTLAECAMMAAACRDCAEQAIGAYELAKREREGHYVH